MKIYIVTVYPSAEIERHYNLKRILKVQVKRLRGRILNVKEYMLNLIAKFTVKISILHISPETAEFQDLLRDKLRAT